MKQSNLFTLNWHDALKGLILAIASPVAVALERYLDAGKMDFSWKALAMIGIGSGLSYIIKNFLTPAQPVKTVVEDADGKVTKTTIETDSVNVNVDQTTK